MALRKVSFFFVCHGQFWRASSLTNHRTKQIKIPPLLALSAAVISRIAQLCSNNNHLRRSVASAEIDMSGTNNLKSAAADMMCCPSCGIAEGDNIKLKTCTACKSARYCRSNVRRTIDQSIKRSAENERLSYVTSFYLSSPRAATSVTARSVVCRYRLRENILP